MFHCTLTINGKEYFLEQDEIRSIIRKADYSLRNLKQAEGRQFPASDAAALRMTEKLSFNHPELR